MAQDLPKVSIIIPCFNSETTIGSTIDSVIAQSFTDWEIIVVDDSSTDNSPAIIKSYIAHNDRIRYFKTLTNSGSPSLPRNIGIEQSRGRYIAFLDSDDLWLPQKLEDQVRFMENNEYDVSYSYYEKIAADGERTGRIIKTFKECDYDTLMKTNSIPMLTSMITKEAVGNSRFLPILQEDICFWLDILKKGYVAYNMCELTALYRVNKQSRSSNKMMMLVGFWNVLRKEQKLPLLRCLYNMMYYIVIGIKKTLS